MKCIHCGGMGYLPSPHDLREAREDCGLSQSQVAREIGISRSYLNHLERGRKPWNASLVKSFRTALGKIGAVTEALL